MKVGFANDSRFAAVAVTGGPCAGKTTFLANARQWLEDRGLRVAVLAEAATELITAGLPPWATWKEPRAFQAHLLEHILEREDRFYRLLTSLESDKQLVLLCDRGALDARAYIPHDEFLEVLEDLGLSLHDLLERYRAVIHLVTTADGAEGFYTLANNAARTESPEFARHLDAKTRDAWLGHRHLSIIDNSAPTFEKKMERCLAALARTLAMPEPLEKERKFFVRSCDLGGIPTMATVDITQTYLRSEQDVERRVRERCHNGASSYFYTEKRPTSDPRIRQENERMITRREYERLLGERDPNFCVVKKIRTTFAFEGRHFELDTYLEPVSGVTMLEIEVEDLDATIHMPPGFDVIEVTGDSRFANASIARDGLAEYPV